jgi:hypothetical protein
MDRVRSVKVKGHFIEEYYWAGGFVVYIDNKHTDETFDEVVQRLNA